MHLRLLTVVLILINETEHLDELRSVQMEGTAALISDKKEVDEILKMLGQKFPSMAKMTSNPENLIIKITPKICHFTDYVKHAGIREKVKY